MYYTLVSTSSHREFFLKVRYRVGAYIPTRIHYRSKFRTCYAKGKRFKSCQGQFIVVLCTISDKPLVKKIDYPKKKYIYIYIFPEKLR